MMDEVTSETPVSEAQHDGFESSVRESLKKQTEFIEPSTPKAIFSSMDSFNRITRRLTKVFAENGLVRWIPVLSPLLNASIDYQKASTAALFGKDIDTGRPLSGKERARVAVTNYGRCLWEQTKTTVDVALFLTGGTIVEKIGGKFIAKTARKVLHFGGDLFVYGMGGRRKEMVKESKRESAANIVDGMPVMYKTAARSTKNAEAKQLLTEASKTFQVINNNPDTKQALIDSLSQSKRLVDWERKMEKMKKNPEVMNRLYSQLSAELSVISH